MPDTWEVVPYSPQGLRFLFSKYSQANQGTINRKLHCTYFDSYFKTLKAATVLVESGYIDRDFFEDYAAYYVRCFEQYARECTRLHFFTIPFSGDEFRQMLENPAAANLGARLKDSYLGFIVVKPLPEAVIGRTCLETYPEAGRRNFPIKRKYEANIYGLKLAVNTLAFQEQDHVAAACATSALWSAFQGTGFLFHHRIPSPVEITQTAVEHTHLNLRTLPSQGLLVDQMANAIRHVRLEPTLLSATDEGVLKGTAYAYVKGGIPVLLLGAILNNSDPTKVEVLGLHAVVVTGYSLGGPASSPQGPSQFLLRATRIDKLYCHDDQVGPFARMEFDAPPGSDLTLSTSMGSNAKNQSIRFVPQSLLIPLYHKIRIPFEVVQDTVAAFDAFLKQVILPRAASVFSAKLEWDIYLTVVNDLKAEIYSDANPNPDRRQLLEARMPKYVWRASCTHASKPIMDLLFDATGLEQSDLCFRVIERDPVLGAIIRGLKANPTAKSQLENEPSWPVVKRF